MKTRDFYAAYYNAVETSRAHARFCEYAYGKDLAQHGFMTMDALELMLCEANISPQHRVLDIGCGNGRITKFISDATFARVTGMDFIPEAIQRAQSRTVNAKRLNFFIGDLMRLPCARQSFDVLFSIDTLYFSDDYIATLKQWEECLREDGTMAIFFSQGANPQNPKETFDRATLPPDRTPLGVALQANGMNYQAWDFTAHDYILAKGKREILEALRDEFIDEGNLFLYENRIAEARGVIDAYESGMHARYLYLARI